MPYEELHEEELEDPSCGMDNDRLTKIFSRRQNVIRTFWKKWRDSNLPTLRSHHQATKGNMKLIIQSGDVVQIHDDKKRIEWKLAVVEGLIRGGDGAVRAAEIRTAKGKTNRPINKLYPIEVKDETTKDQKPQEQNTEIVSESSPTKRDAAKQAEEKIKKMALLSN